MNTDLKGLIEQISRNTTAQQEQSRKWRQEMGLPGTRPAAPKVGASERIPADSRAQKGGAAALRAQRGGAAAPGAQRGGPAAPRAQRGGAAAARDTGGSQGGGRASTPASQSGVAEGGPLSQQCGHRAGMPSLEGVKILPA
ncbi:UNVERIFIED_CONTAM: hypothetical protein FKN15_027030 [Acipenser sinensis]